MVVSQAVVCLISTRHILERLPFRIDSIIVGSPGKLVIQNGGSLRAFDPWRKATGKLFSLSRP